MLECVLPSLEERGEVFLANRRLRLISHRGKEGSVHLVAEVRDGLRLGHCTDLLEQALSEVALVVRVVHEKGVWFEVVAVLVNFIRGIYLNSAALR